MVLPDQAADLYICPSCLSITFWFEQKSSECGRCGNSMFRVYASPEAQHLLVEIASEEGEEIASLVTFLLQELEHPLLAVKVKEEYMQVLRKNHKALEKAVKSLKRRVSPDVRRLSMRFPVSL